MVGMLGDVAKAGVMVHALIQCTAQAYEKKIVVVVNMHS